ncbi:hypothetical protein [Spiroplasma endosymbiont of Nebria brevicollis]|uniref:hypothetical protein n=1 Tax=Spiroplasma endosymbiont of Nebria brevicollis TaxID=3066284 RepID=UPI00313E341A
MKLLSYLMILIFFNKAIEKDFDFFFKIKEQINTFLTTYFVINENITEVTKSIPIEKYDDNIKTIIENFIETYDESRYSKILKFIKNFNNYKENNEQKAQPSSSRKEMKNNNNLKLFNFEKLELAPWSVINLIPNYHYFLQEYKTPCSQLIFIPDNSLKEVKSNSQEQEKKSENKSKKFNEKIEKYVQKRESKEIKNSFYFAQMLLFEECNEEEQVVFQELKNKITTKNESIFFTKDKRFGLLSDTQNNNPQNLPLLINFTTLIKMPKKFFPLIHDCKKIVI